MKQLVQKICEHLSMNRNEAELVAARLLNLPRHELYFQRIDDTRLHARLESQIDQLKTGMPIEYVTRTVQFLDLELAVVPGVFIPRLETELIIEIISKRTEKSPGLILEIGTGTGAISIAIARRFKDCTILATDISDRALRCARSNIRKYRLEDRIMLCRADMLEGIKGSYDLIVSNPPYVSPDRMERLPRSVRDFEPAAALAGGRDGIEMIAGIITNAYNLINEHGGMLLEIDDDQVDLISQLLTHHKIRNYYFLKDLFGRFRYLIINKAVL